MVLLINETIMNLQGSIVKQITAEILHHAKNFAQSTMDNLLVTIFLFHL